jgi:hypothetical protein
MSAFECLFDSGCDQSLITLTGFSHNAFRYLLVRFQPLYDALTPYSTDGYIVRIRVRDQRRGRPRSMTATQCLALVLTWGRSRGPTAFLSMVFGVTHSVMALFLRFGRRLLIKALREDVNARVALPTQDEVRDFQRSISAKYNLLDKVCAIADGLKLHLQASRRSEVQNMFYNGWTHDHYVDSVFVFSPAGTVIACALNAPGCMHDSQIAEWGNVYSKLESVFDATGGQVVVDSAFSKAAYHFLLKSGDDVVLPTEQSRQVTSLRQSAEWGMRALQAGFPRLKDRLFYKETGERKCILYSLVLLFNLRSRIVGMNQISSTFYSTSIEQTANDIFNQ